MEQDYHADSDFKHDFDKWFAFRSPVPTVAILSFYLFTVYFTGPWFMKNRRAYKLKSFIVVYNVFQVLACYHIVSSILSVNIPILNFWTCSVYASDSPERSVSNHISSFTYWLKAIELIETVVFVLRKKQNQVSFLHVFHHCATLTLVFILVKHYRGEAAMFPIFLNSNVHIVMYTYYLAAAVLPDKVVRKLITLKKLITIGQMGQFTLILLQVVFQVVNGCQAPTFIIVFYIFCVVVIFYLFYDFYKKAYDGKRIAAKEQNGVAKKSSRGVKAAK